MSRPEPPQSMYIEVATMYINDILALFSFVDYVATVVRKGGDSVLARV